MPFENFTPYRMSRVIDMADGNAEAHFVRDIGGLGGDWRWTGKHPEVRVSVRTKEMMACIVDFTIVAATLKDTGPVTLTFFVNGHELDKQTYSTEGARHFERPVPPDWIQAGKDATVGAEIDKVWISPGDGAALGFVLSRMGLVQTGTQTDTAQTGATQAEQNQQ